MKRVSRRFKRHFGVTANQVTVRSRRPWYWSWAFGLLLIVVGFLGGSWWHSVGEVTKLTTSVNASQSESQELRTRLILAERQLQVEKSAQQTLARELEKLQDDDVRLKEDLAFYQNIFSEKTSASELRLQNFKLSKLSAPGRYAYQVVLVQSGIQDKFVKGSLHLVLNGTRSGAAVSLPLEDAAHSGNVSFRYFLRLGGEFTVPDNVQAGRVEASFLEMGAKQPKISQSMALPV